MGEYVFRGLGTLESLRLSPSSGEWAPSRGRPFLGLLPQLLSVERIQS
jgi:hypothetical protein